MIVWLRKRFFICFFLLLLVMLLIANLYRIERIFYPIKYKALIENYSAEYNLDPLLVTAVIKAESKFNPNALSRKGAIGLMQIIPKTGRWAAGEIGIKNFEAEDLYSPEINIRIGCWYLNNLRKEFGNNLQLVLAAYNGGSGNVTKWLQNEEYSIDGNKLDNIPFPETRLYVQKVERFYVKYRELYQRPY